MEINRKTGTQSGKRLVAEVGRPGRYPRWECGPSLFPSEEKQTLTVYHAEFGWVSCFNEPPHTIRYVENMGFLLTRNVGTATKYLLLRFPSNY